METTEYSTLHAHVVKDTDKKDSWRRPCGCLKTSDKLKQLLRAFPPPPPPPSPTLNDASAYPYDGNCFTVSKCIYPTSFGLNSQCISSHCKHHGDRPSPKLIDVKEDAYDDISKKEVTRNRSWQLVSDLVQLLQLSVTATALALYYLIYCYMQLVYYMLRSALYFHNADGPMKVTIGVVTITSLIVGLNLLIRMERLIGVF